MREKKLVVFNWKENPATLREAFRLFLALKKLAHNGGHNPAEVVVCPPSIYLAELSKRLSREKAGFLLGAQDVFWENSGAYTGEIGPAMLCEIGKNVQYVIIGHSERRRFLGETDEMVNRKVRAALGAGLHVILCVGEPADVREQGITAARQYVKNQLKKDLQGIGALSAKRLALSIAYEPIWAIGTGKNAEPEDARDMSIFIKKEVAPVLRSLFSVSPLLVLYGGSVTGDTFADYLCYNEINGVLVGGASLHPKEISKMIKNS